METEQKRRQHSSWMTGRGGSLVCFIADMDAFIGCFYFLKCHISFATCHKTRFGNVEAAKPK